MSDTGHHELQQTLSRLQRSYKLLNDAASIARIGCFEWEIEADRSSWSREMYEILGLDREELGDDIKAEFIFEMIHPDDLDHMRENHIRGLAENRIIPSEFRVIRPDKSVATVYASGKSVRLLGTLQDITERKQAEESQRRSDELYRQVTDAIPALIAYVDAQQCYRSPIERSRSRRDRSAHGFIEGPSGMSWEGLPTMKSRSTSIEYWATTRSRSRLSCHTDREERAMS